jgi:hypothetical protein
MIVPSSAGMMPPSVMPLRGGSVRKAHESIGSPCQTT